MFVPVIKAVSSVNWAADCTGQEIGKSLERVLERKKKKCSHSVAAISKVCCYVRRAESWPRSRSLLYVDYGRAVRSRAESERSIKISWAPCFFITRWTYCQRFYPPFSLRRILHRIHVMCGSACEYGTSMLTWCSSDRTSWIDYINYQLDALIIIYS